MMTIIMDIVSIGSRFREDIAVAISNHNVNAVHITISIGNERPNDCDAALTIHKARCVSPIRDFWLGHDALLGRAL